MLTPDRVRLGASVSYQQLVQSYAGVLYYPLTDVVTTTAGSATDVLGLSDGTYDQEISSRVSPNSGAIFDGSTDSIQFITGSGAGFRTGAHQPVSYDDWTWIFWSKATSAAQDAVEWAKIGGTVTDFTGSTYMRWSGGATATSVGTNLGTLVASTAFDATALNMHVIVGKKDGATWDYEAYLNAVSVGTLLNKAQFTDLDTMVYGTSNNSLNGTKISGISLHASAEGGGGALSAAQITALYNKGTP